MKNKLLRRYMKKIIIYIFIFCFLLLGCSNTCEHKDEDSDGLCDKCGEKYENKCTEHIDDNNDNVCDECGDSLKVECNGHVDENNDTHHQIAQTVLQNKPSVAHVTS